MAVIVVVNVVEVVVVIEVVEAVMVILVEVKVLMIVVVAVEVVVVVEVGVVGALTLKHIDTFIPFLKVCNCVGHSFYSLCQWSASQIASKIGILRLDAALWPFYSHFVGLLKPDFKCRIEHKGQFCTFFRETCKLYSAVFTVQCTLYNVYYAL